MQIRLILWGIGQVYNSVINLLKCYENLGQIEIISNAVSVADVPRSKIVSYRILKIPGFDFPKYDLVKNQRGGG